MEKTLIRFDYAIKYLLKYKEGYKIVEGFISALFVSEGYQPVKIKALLNDESNKETRHFKNSIVDLIVEDEQGNNYIVEIDRAYTNHVLQKQECNTSRLIVDYIGAHPKEIKIQKVIHIYLLYFLDGPTQASLHYGKVICHEIENTHPIDVHLIDMRMHIFDAHNIFPEYFIVSIHLFDDVIKEEIHEWLYYMKHAQVKKYFKSPYMKKVGQRLDILKMSNKERNIYDSYVMDAMKGRDYIVSAVAKGMQEGMKKRTVLDIAKNMLVDNFDINEISKLTALTVEKIQQLHTQVLS